MGGMAVKDIESILMRDPHIQKIYHDNFQFPWTPSIRRNLWQKTYQEKQRLRIYSLIRFVCSPCILDNFGNDNARRQTWIEAGKQENPAVFHYYRRHALTLKKIESVRKKIGPLQAGFVGGDYETFSELINQAVSGCSLLPQEVYAASNVEEKMAAITKAKEGVYHVLMFLFNQKGCGENYIN